MAAQRRRRRIRATVTQACHNAAAARYEAVSATSQHRGWANRPGSLFGRSISNLLPSIVGYEVQMGNHLAATEILGRQLDGMLADANLIFARGWPDPTTGMAFPRLIGEAGTGRILSLNPGNLRQELDALVLQEAIAAKRR